MAKRIATSLAVGLLTVGAAAAQADVLLLDGIEVDQPSAAERPRAGMSMDRVESTYGAPGPVRRGLSRRSMPVMV